MNDGLGIGVMSSVNFKDRYNACKLTWLKDFDNTYIFGGHKSNEVDDCLISIENAGEDWPSCFLKQQMGLKYMYEDNSNYDWYSISGCDNVLFKEKLISEIKNYDPNLDFFIGQKCGFWTDVPVLKESHNGHENTFCTIAGGASFFISNSLMKKIYPYIIEFNEYWKKNAFGIIYGCADIAISLMIKRYASIEVTENPYLFGQSDRYYLNVINNEFDVNRRWYSLENIKNFEKNIQTPISLHYIKPDEMSEIYEKYKFSSEQNFKKLCQIPSDINEHLITLKQYAEKCNDVTEMGTRHVVSTWAFIEAKPKKIRCYDLIYDYYKPSEFIVNKTCDEYGIDFKFISGDTLEIDIEDTDLLFIDTLHTHDQLLGELRKHSKNVRKWIILHDTTLFGFRDESIYEKSSEIIKKTTKTGSGLLQAVDTFLNESKKWSIKEVFTNCNGLTILEKINN